VKGGRKRRKKEDHVCVDFFEIGFYQHRVGRGRESRGSFDCRPVKEKNKSSSRSS